VRDDRVDEDKGEVGVTIVVWRFGIDREIEGPATGWVRVGGGGARRTSIPAKPTKSARQWRARVSAGRAIATAMS
jgi:hypothetical protein